MSHPRRALHRSALLFAFLSILAGIPIAPLTPFLCIDHAGHSDLELGTGSIIDGPDEPGNTDEGDLTPSDDPSGNQPNRCHDVRLEIQAGSLHTASADASYTPSVAAVILPHIVESAPLELANTSVQPFANESPPGSARLIPLRI